MHVAVKGCAWRIFSGLLMACLCTWVPALGAPSCTAGGGAAGGLLSGIPGFAGLGALSSPLASLTGQGPAPPAGESMSGATSGPACQPGEPASLAPQVPGSLAGNPFDVVTGSKHERIVDVFLPTLAPVTADPLEFAFVRLYSSDRPASGAFGPGWSHSFETRLEAAGVRRVVLRQADGRVIEFGAAVVLRNGGQRFAPRNRSDGVLDRLPPHSRDRWVWRWRNGRQLVFGVSGRLERIVSLDRDAIALGYDASERLVAVSDNRGRALRIEYHDAPMERRIAALLVADRRVLRYRYDAEARLVGADADARHATAYRYEDARAAHRLTAVVGQDGARSAYEYDERGRVIRSRGIDEPDGQALVVRYQDPAAHDGIGQTEVAQADAPERSARYRWRVVPGQGGRLLSSDGAACAACPPVGRSYRYDARGALTAIASGTGRVTIARDRFGRPVTLSTDATAPVAAANSVRLPADNMAHEARLRQGAVHVDWHDDPVLDLPRLVRRASVVPGRWYERRFRYSEAGQPVAIEERGFSPVAVEAAAPAPAPRRDASPGRTLAAAQALTRRVDIAYVAEGPARGRIAAIDGPLPGDGDRVRLSYDARRSLVAVDPLPTVSGSAARMALRADEVPTLAALVGASVVGADARPGVLEVRAPGGAGFGYRLDDFGRVVSLRSPDGSVIDRAHDEADRIVAERDAVGSLARYRFDALGRPLEYSIEAPGREPLVTRYDQRDGRLHSIEHPEQSEAFRYDERGRLASVVTSLRDDDGRAIAFRRDRIYDAQRDAPIAQTLPDGSTLWFETDAGGAVVGLLRSADWLPGVQRIAGAIRRDASGLHALGFGNRTRLSIGRDAQGRIESLEHLQPRGALRGGGRVIYRQAVTRDERGLVVATAQQHTHRRMLRDDRDRLIQVVERLGWPHAPGAVGEAGVEGAAVAATVDDPSARIWRFHHDALGNWVLAMQADDVAVPEAVTMQTGLAVAPRGRLRHGPVGAQPVHVQFDAAGRTLADGTRRYRWNSAGLLETVELADGRSVAFRYNHRGERVASVSAQSVTRFLYQDGHPVAELDGKGRVLRMYLYLHGLPLAVVDAEPGWFLGPEARGRERIRFLHLDHRATPVAASDETGRVLWRADHAPYGRRIAVRSAGAPAQDERASFDRRSAGSFDLALRLPGQYEDADTGLHYNGHRYYDPDQGRYLSPDPLGLRGGLNPFAYAGNDPIRYADPDGLLLFAFDGTENSDPPPRRDDWSNVYKLARAYADGRVWYVSGVGRADAGAGVQGGSVDAVLASTARARVDHMLGELERFLSAAPEPGRWTDVDVIGFSRGAAMARDFSNRVAERLRSGAYARVGACVRLRFLGLWDTVAQFGLNGVSNLAWSLAVPSELAYAAHAMALNEHRTLFPAESILGVGGSGPRVERGFVGAHSDVGGGYAEGDLSDVSLAWMHAQARVAGVPMAPLPERFLFVGDPLLHDSSLVAPGDREVRYRNAAGWTYANPLQRAAPVPGLRWRDTGQFITRFDAPRPDAYGNDTLVGRVEMERYRQWLASHYGTVLAGP